MRLISSLFKRRILREGVASRVVFYFPLEEGTYLDNPRVVIYENGIVDIQHEMERVTTHVQNVEVIWTNRRNTNNGSGFKLLKLTDRSGR